MKRLEILRGIAEISFVMGLTFLTSAQGFAALSKNGLPLPAPEWVDFVNRSRTRNTLTRMIELRPLEESVVKIYVWEIPERSLKDGEFVHRSEFITQEDEKVIGPVADGEKKVRLFILDKENEKGPDGKKEEDKVAEAREEYGPETALYYGGKFQSHSSYLVWDHEGAIPLGTLKMDTFDGRRSVATSDIFDSILRHQPPQFRDDPDTVNFDATPERFAIRIDLGGKPYVNIFRSNGTIKEKNISIENVFPLHGLGKILDDGPWFREEFLPKLAKWTAQLHLVLGVHPQLHSQNVMVVLEPSSKKIKKFLLKDFRDVAYDPETLRSLSHFVKKLGVFPAHVEDLMWTGDGLLLDARHQGAAYLAQSILGNEGNHFERQDDAVIFIDSYLKEAERILKRPVKLSRSTRRLLSLARSWNLPNHLVETDHDENLPKLIGKVVEDAYFSKRELTLSRGKVGLKKIMAELKNKKESLSLQLVSAVFHVPYCSVLLKLLPGRQWN